MPYVAHSSYVPPLGFKNRHIQSVVPVILRPILGVKYQRERLETLDSDFLDLDWSKVGSKRLAILTHGLEAHSKYTYIKGMVRACNRAGMDALCWHLRGCGGEVNRKPFFYHGGVFEDLAHVVNYVLRNYDEIYLIGFSLGGSITLNYLGEQGDSIHPKIKSSVNFSAPLDFMSCSPNLSADKNRFYFYHFMWTIRQKMKIKAKSMDLPVSWKDVFKFKSFQEFDHVFTAPLAGFEGVEQLWKNNSALYKLDRIRVLTLLVNAMDDPLLSPLCFPRDIAENSRYFYLETPRYGGHVGFMSFERPGEYWSEARAIEFMTK